MATSEGGLMEMELCDVGSTSDGMVRRVPSFMNLDEDFSSMPVFGMTPLLDKTDETPKFVDEVIVSPSHNSVEESDDNFFVQTSVIAKTPTTTLHNGVYAMENIPSIDDIERMSGPLLRGYLKSVGINKKGKRSELMNLLIDEFVRYREDPELYLSSIADIVPKSNGKKDALGSSSKGSSGAGGRRTKKRSLRAREAEESLRSPVEQKKSLRVSATPPPPLATDSKKQTSDPEHMTDALRLERYETIARQVVRSTTGQKDLSQRALLDSFSTAFGFNSHGTHVDSADEKGENPDAENLDLLGRRIEVLWMQDLTNNPMWYAGTVVHRSDGLKPFHTVVYDDGEERVENLRSKRWRFASSQVQFIKSP